MPVAAAALLDIRRWTSSRSPTSRGRAGASWCWLRPGRNSIRAWSRLRCASEAPPPDRGTVSSVRRSGLRRSRSSPDPPSSAAVLDFGEILGAAALPLDPSTAVRRSAAAAFEACSSSARFETVLSLAPPETWDAAHGHIRRHRPGSAAPIRSLPPHRPDQRAGGISAGHIGSASVAFSVATTSSREVAAGGSCSDHSNA